MACEVISTMESFSDFLVYPLGCDYYFWLKIIIFAIFPILAWTLYSVEKLMKPDVDILSCLGVSSIAIIILSLIGTLIKSSSDISMISSGILLIIIAFATPIILIWFFKD